MAPNPLPSTMLALNSHLWTLLNQEETLRTTNLIHRSVASIVADEYLLIIFLQQFLSTRTLFNDADSNYELNTNFDASFTNVMDPVFQTNFSNTGDFPANDMPFPLGFDVPDDATSQSLDMFSNSLFVPLPQTSLQPTTQPEQLTTQHNWADLANFNLTLPGRKSNVSSPVGTLSQQNAQVILPCRNQSISQSQALSPFPQPPPPPPQQQQQQQQLSKQMANFSSTFIPTGKFLVQTPDPLVDVLMEYFTEVAASITPRPGGGKVASEYYNIYSTSGFDMFGILVSPRLSTQVTDTELNLRYSGQNSKSTQSRNRYRSRRHVLRIYSLRYGISRSTHCLRVRCIRATYWLHQTRNSWQKLSFSAIARRESRPGRETKVCRRSNCLSVEGKNPSSGRGSSQHDQLS